MCFLLVIGEGRVYSAEYHFNFTEITRHDLKQKKRVEAGYQPKLLSFFPSKYQIKIF